MDLVTGGAGFTGSFLARRLLEAGREVRVFDLAPTQYLPEGAEFIAGDMRDRALVREAVRGVEHEKAALHTSCHRSRLAVLQHAAPSPAPRRSHAAGVLPE